MPVSCVAVGCANRWNKATNRKFYAFPKDSPRQRAWLQALRRVNFPPKSGIKSYHRICSDHFVTGLYIRYYHPALCINSMMSCVTVMKDHYDPVHGDGICVWLH